MREKEKYMNKKTKLLLVLLSSTALTAGAFGLAACSGEAHNEEYYAQYQQYVEAAAEGDVLSYEEWLIGILEDAKGEKGDKGDTGEAGKDGTKWTVGEGEPAAADGADGDFYLNKTTFDVYTKTTGTWQKIGSIKGADGAAGANGAGIESITYKNGALEVALTSGTKLTVAIPEEITHVHTFDENAEVIVIMDSTYEHQGVGYIKCNKDGCEYKELVVIPIRTYRVALTYEGAPLKNVNVTLAGEGVDESGKVTVATDENGEALLDVDALGAYTISVEGYTVLGGNVTTSNNTSYTLEVAKNLPQGGITEAGIYAAVVTSESYIDSGWWGEDVVEVINPQTMEIIAGEENVKLRASIVNNSDAMFAGDSWGDTEADVEADGSYVEYIRAGESTEIYCSVNAAFFESGKYEYGDTIIYAVKIEYLEAPADGAIAEFALDGAALTDGGITMTAEPDQWIYYSWTNPDTSYSRLNITLGEGTTLEFTTKSNWTNVPVTLTESGVIQFTDTALTTNFSFKVKSSTGNISLSAEFYAEVGEMSNPAELALDTQTSGTVSSGAPKYYYKWTAAEAGNYTLVVSGASTAEVYSDASYSDEYMLLNIQSDRGVFAAEAGKTYYFAAGTTNVYTATEYKILLRKTTAEDAGSSAAYPVALTAESSLSFDNFKGTRYYTYENSSEEAVTFKLVTAGNEDTSVSVGYYSDSTFSWSSNIGSGSVAVTVEAGQTIYVLLEVYPGPNNFTGTATVEIGVPEPPVEPDIPDGVDPGEIKIPSGGNALESAGYWQITLTAEDWSDSYGYYEKRLNFIGEAGTYTITCQAGATMTDMYGEPVTTIESTGSPVRLYLDADKAGDYIITITAVTEEA